MGPPPPPHWSSRSAMFPEVQFFSEDNRVKLLGGAGPSSPAEAAGPLEDVSAGDVADEDELDMLGGGSAGQVAPDLLGGLDTSPAPVAGGHATLLKGVLAGRGGWEGFAKAPPEALLMAPSYLQEEASSEPQTPATFVLAFMEQVALPAEGAHGHRLLRTQPENWVEGQPLVKGRLGASPESGSGSASASASASAAGGAAAAGADSGGGGDGGKDEEEKDDKVAPPPPASVTASSSAANPLSQKCAMEPTYFSSPTDCYVCDKFVWGITKSQQKGMQCTRPGCGRKIHAKCADSSTVPCFGFGAAADADATPSPSPAPAVDAKSEPKQETPEPEPEPAVAANEPVPPPPSLIPSSPLGGGGEERFEPRVAEGDNAGCFHAPRVMYVTPATTVQVLGEGADAGADAMDHLDTEKGQILIEAWVAETTWRTPPARHSFRSPTANGAIFKRRQWTFSAADLALVSSDEMHTFRVETWVDEAAEMEKEMHAMMCVG